MSKSGRETPSIQSLGRGLSILEAVADSSDPVPLKDLTALLGIDRSSVFRLANTLKRRRFLASPFGRKDYILGPSIWRLSRKVRPEHADHALPGTAAKPEQQDG